MVQDPVVTVWDLLDPDRGGQWDNTNTSINYDPEIHTGWYTPDSNSPEVTISNPDEGPLGGGETGFIAFDASGRGGVQEIDGIVNVDCWSDREVEPNVNPKKLAYEFTEEVIRIIEDNQITATDLRNISYNGRTFVPPESNEEEPVSHYNVEISYLYRRGP